MKEKKEQVSEGDKVEHLFNRILMDSGIILGVTLIGFFPFIGHKITSFFNGDSCWINLHKY